MTWMLWRQHRFAGALTLGLLTALAALVLVTGRVMAERYQTMVSCSSNCTINNQLDVLRGLDAVVVIIDLTVAVPLLLGVFWGAATMAHEFETDMHVLSWTQTVTRRRWTAAQIATSMGVAVGWGAALSVLATWWAGPLNRMRGNEFAPGTFDTQGVLPLAYGLFAVALGLAAGVTFRRVVPALFVTVAAFATVRIGFLFGVRPRLMTPVTGLVDAEHLDATTSGSWVLDEQTSSAGSQYLLTYQPADRFWTFQAIEAGVFVALAAALLLWTWLAVTRRDA